jgi:putative polyhydroxyalkanoate system protein
VPDIRIRRDHDLGLARAREIAWRWAEQVEQQFGMDCSVLEGETSDTVHFERSGCQGRLIVAADHFDLDARLGFLLGAFSSKIESEVERTLDALLAASTTAAPKGRPPAAPRAGSAPKGGGAARTAKRGAAAAASSRPAAPKAAAAPSRGARKTTPRPKG